MDRPALYKQLYNAARRATAAHWQDDGDKVRELRDMATYELYGLDYTQLRNPEIQNIIDELDARSGNLNEPKPKKEYASPRQINLLRFYAILCAIHYSILDFTVIDDDGYEYQGDTLRAWLRIKFEHPGGRVPTNAFRHLHINWINPKSHIFLEEGGFKKFTKVPTRFYYQYLKPAEAQYLINRFREIALNLNMAVNIEDIVKQIELN